jgi:RNA polymerase sporulation-specific sigma factor
MRRRNQDNDYKRLLGKCPVLTREEEYEAWKRGDTDLLIRSQLPWVMRIATSVCTKLKFKDRDAVISAANVALMKSVQSFDASKGFKLSTYVFRLAYWASYDEISKSVNQGQTRGVYKRNPLQFRPLPDMAAEKLYDDKDDAEVIEYREEIDQLYAVISQLPEHYAFVVEGRLQGKTYDEIASECGVTKQAIQQRFHSAKLELKRLLEGKFAA